MRVKFFNGGHCLQLQALVDRRTWRVVPFYAVFLAVEHPSRGWILVDSGYSTYFAEATRGWPRCLYRWVTPVHPDASTPEILRRGGVDPGEIRDMVVTHFHADHVGGLRDFPAVKFHFCREAWSQLQELSAFAQTRHAFLPGLLPGDLADRANPIPLASFREDPRFGLPSFDLLGDGTIILVSLPGHAPGQVGIFLPEADGGPLLYAADAFWHHRQVDETLEPAAPAKILIHDRVAYRATITRLRELARSREMRLVGCHCPRTQSYVNS